MKLSIYSLALMFLLGAFLTSSFDIFLNVKIGGFSLRFVFIFIMLQLFIAWIYIILKGYKENLNFLGFYFILIWVIFLIFFIPNTTVLNRNIAYVLWLILYVLFVPVLPIFFKSASSFNTVIKYYFTSFELVAIFGIVQFLLGLAGIDILIMQYWKNGMPRANAFSYEPSYFATYLMIMWAIAFTLIVHKSKLVKTYKLKRKFGLTTVAIILSGSRMGILLIVMIIGAYVLYGLKDVFLRLKIKKQIFPYFIGLSGSIMFLTLYFFFNYDQLLIYVNGLGLFGTVAHSYDYRTSDFENTLIAFIRSPFIGYSLGGVPSAIAQVRGLTITTQQEAKNFEGLNIFAEVLAASGIFGFVFFMLFLYTIFKKCFDIIKITAITYPEYSQLMRSLIYAFLFELIILSLNQNILRAYVWIHIAILNLGFFVGLSMIKKDALNSGILEKSKIKLS